MLCFGLFEILIGDAGSMCTRIVIHQNEIFTNSTCIWADVNIQDLVYVPESRQRAVVNDVEVRFPLITFSSPNHDWAPAKPIIFCHTNWSKTLIWHFPYPSTSIGKVHTKPGHVCKQDWGPVILGPSDMIPCPCLTHLHVISGQRNPDCRSSWPQASIMQPISDGLGTYAHTGSVLEVPT